MVTQMQGDAKLDVIDDINNLVTPIHPTINYKIFIRKIQLLETYFKIQKTLFLL